MCIHRHTCTRTHVYTDSRGYTQLRAELPRVHMHARTPAHTDTVAHTLSAGTPTQHHDPPRPLTGEPASQMHPERMQDEAGRTTQGGAALMSYSGRDPHGASRSESLGCKPEQARQPGQLRGKLCGPQTGRHSGTGEPSLLRSSRKPRLRGLGAWEAGGGWSGQEEAVGSSLESIRPRPSPRVKPAHS